MSNHNGKTGTWSGAEAPSSTSTSLIERLQAQEPDAWGDFSKLYGSLVYDWARRWGLQPNDAADIVQQVFQSVAVSINRFRNDRPGDSFRAWLKTVTNNAVRNHFRQTATRPEATGGTDAYEHLRRFPAPLPEDTQESREADEIKMSHRLLEVLKANFTEQTWQVFWQVTMDRRQPGDVAEEFGMSVGAVYMAKSRVLRRLRQELDD